MHIEYHQLIIVTIILNPNWYFDSNEYEKLNKIALIADICIKHTMWYHKKIDSHLQVLDLIANLASIFFKILLSALIIFIQWIIHLTVILIINHGMETF